MRIETSLGATGTPTVVTAVGELDALTATDLRETFMELIDAGRSTLVFDASGLSFLDSTGVGVLVIALKRTRARGGSFALAGASAPVLRVFVATGLDRVFRMYDDVDAAVGAATGRHPV